MSITQSLRRAAQLQEKIETLREQLADVLDKARAELAATPAEETSIAPRRGRAKKKKALPGRRATAATVPAKRRGKPAKIDGRTKGKRNGRAGHRSPLRGVKRAASPSGPLAPAVVKVLSARKQPMSVRDILAGLFASGYQFNSSEPKKNLAARIYRLKGVRQVSAGLFAAV